MSALLRSPFVRALLVGVISLAASTGGASAFCPEELIITAPTTVTTTVLCARITDATIEGDVTNNTRIGDPGSPHNAVVIEFTTVTGRFINNGVITQAGSPGADIAFATWASDVQGGIVNNGVINSGTGIGLSIGALVDSVAIASDQTGAIDNFGRIEGGLAGFDALAGTFLNRLWNHGGAVINGGSYGIVTDFWFTQWLGGIVNDGTISGGINGLNLGQFTPNGLTFTGGIKNGATGVISGATASAIVIQNAQFSGGIVNDGTLNGFFRGIFVDASTFSGGIVNSATGEIFGNVFPGIYVNGSTFAGGIDNAGHIASTTEHGIQVTNTVSSFSGDIVNRAGGLIEGATGGIEMRSTNWSGNLSNAGTIRANTTGDGVLINNSLGVWDGDVVNDGLIQGGAGPVLDNAALHLELAEWNGGVLNRGTITGPASGFLVGVDVWNGDFDNRGSISGAAGVGIGSNAFTGNILNSASGVIQGQLFGLGLCNADCQEESAQTGVDFLGSLVNSGSILKTSTALDGGLPLGAVTIFANSWTGDIVNQATGLISSPTLAVVMAKQNAFFGEGFDPLPVVLFDGDFVNRGTITGAVDLRIADWTGNFDNSGSITATGAGVAAFKLVGGIEGLLLNSGTITGDIALDLAGMTSSATYRQTGATARTEGDILMSATAATTLDFRGGRFTGDVVGAGLDDRFEVNAGPAGSFAYVEGVLANIAALSVNSGTAIFGSTAVGANGAGVTMTNAGALSVGAGSTLYLDDNTSISATSLSLTPTSTFAAFLTTNTAQHGSIAVSEGATLAGSFVAHIDAQSFLGSGQTEFMYSGLISGPVSGTFSSVTIAGAPALFTITPIYNSFDVLIERVLFEDLADPESPNQGSVGNALDEIYEEGTDDPDLLNLIDTLGEGGDTGEILDAIAGGTQADTDLAALKSDDPWKQSVGQRVDAARSTGCTITGDTWCRTRYAQAPAAPVQTDAAEDPDAFAWLDTGLRDVGATSVWGRLVGIWGETDGGVSSPASNQRTYAVIAGADHVVDGTLLVGLAGQYVRTKADFDGSENESSVESVQAGAYFSYGGAETYLNGNVSAIATHASTKRIFSVGAIDYLAHVRYPSTSVTGALELGTIFEVGGGYRLEPHAGLNFVGQFTDAYAEHGAGGLGLIVDPDDVHSLRSLIGARASRVYELGDRKIVPELRLEWRHEYLDRNTTFLAAFQGAPDVTFLVACEPTARDVVVVGGGLTLPVSGRITGYLDAEGAFSEDTRAGTLSLGARATW